ncbi:60S ribosomal protein L24 [Galdieria sulphuraria]|nr:60S ribosomal protein L24 [Galdieria sulphuraria]
MVVKTETCIFSGFRIYPGKGTRFVRGDGKLLIFSSRKCKTYFHMRRRPAELNWTQLYRRLHKKGQHEETQRRRRTRKVASVAKPVEGASLEVIKAKRLQRPEVRKSAKEAALKEIKERNASKKGKKTTTGVSQPPAGAPKVKQVGQRKR